MCCDVRASQYLAPEVMDMGNTKKGYDKQVDIFSAGVILYILCVPFVTCLLPPVTYVCAVLCCAVLCCAVLCCAVLCCAVLCCAVLCCAVLWRGARACTRCRLSGTQPFVTPDEDDPRPAPPIREQVARVRRAFLDRFLGKKLIFGNQRFFQNLAEKKLF